MFGYSQLYYLHLLSYMSIESTRQLLALHFVSYRREIKKKQQTLIFVRNIFLQLKLEANGTFRLKFILQYRNIINCKVFLLTYN